MTITAKTKEVVETKFRHEVEQLYGAEGVAEALERAMELWLQVTQDEMVARERKLNNDALSRLQPELERQQGRYVVIAHGKLQGVGDSIESIRGLAPDALHRLVFRVGESPSRRRRLGWRVHRK
jgi:hypothetical protein